MTLAISFLSVSVFLSACGKMDTTTAVLPQETGGDKNELENLKVCYQQGKVCFKAVETSKVASTNKEFKYPDEKNFPDADKEDLYTPPDLLIPLDASVEAKEISKNFTAGEFMSVAKGAFGFVAPHLVKTVQSIRDLVKASVRITSGYRSPGYNNGVPGSANWSRHTYGDAVDLQIPSKSLADIKTLCEQKDASFVLVYTAHVHCDWRLVGKEKSRIERYQLIAQGQVSARKLENGLVVLSVTGLQSEDPEDLVYEWSIQSPSGEVKHFNNSKVALKTSRGQYKVSVTVGMTVVLEQIFNW